MEPGKTEGTDDYRENGWMRAVIQQDPRLLPEREDEGAVFGVYPTRRFTGFIYALRVIFFKVVYRGFEVYQTGSGVFSCQR